MPANSAKPALRVIEWVRYPTGVWNLPRELAAGLAAAVPGVQVHCPETRAEAEALLPEADVVLGFLVRPENLAAARKLRWIHSTAASATHVLFPALTESDVVVTNARGLHADAMAEHALGVMLAFVRQLHHARDAQRARVWAQEDMSTRGFGTLGGATLGLVGLGAIGGALATRARALGMRVLAVRQHPAADPAPAHAQWPVSRLHDLLEQSDFVVVVAPHTSATERMFGAAEFARMKPGARFVNLGRGALADEAALVGALRSGRLAGAALDVFQEEPLPKTSALWELPEVILTPHISGLGPHYWERAMVQFVENLRRYVAGEPLHNVVDKRAGY